MQIKRIHASGRGLMGLCWLVSTCLYASGALAMSVRPPSDLPPEARPHNERGVDLIEAGKYAAGVDELERAYMLMPDPLRYRAGRSKVLGSMRSGLNRLHESTGDLAHLRRLEGYLLRYLEALLVALGDSATAGDTAGSLAALREVEEVLAREGASASPPVATPAAVTTRPRPAIKPPTIAPSGPGGDIAPVPSTGLRRARGALLGVGFAALGVMTYAVVVQDDSWHQLRFVLGQYKGSGVRPPAEQVALADEQYQRSRTHRTLGIVTGVVGVTALVTSAVLHGLVRRSRRRVTGARITPTFAYGYGGLDLRLRF